MHSRHLNALLNPIGARAAMPEARHFQIDQRCGGWLAVRMPSEGEPHWSGCIYFQRPQKNGREELEARVRSLLGNVGRGEIVVAAAASPHTVCAQATRSLSTAERKVLADGERYAGRALCVGAGPGQTARAIATPTVAGGQPFAVAGAAISRQGGEASTWWQWHLYVLGLGVEGDPQTAGRRAQAAAQLIGLPLGVNLEQSDDHYVALAVRGRRECGHIYRAGPGWGWLLILDYGTTVTKATAAAAARWAARWRGLHLVQVGSAA